MTQFRCATSNLGNCGEWSHPNKIKHFVESIIRDLQYPELIAVQEMGAKAQDNSNSPVDAMIAHAICGQLNATINDFNHHYQYIEVPPSPNSSGGEPLFNIRCGFFYRSPLKIESLQTISADEPVFKGDDQFSASRHALALFATINNQPILFINCHLKSMNSHGRAEERLAKHQRNRQMELIHQFSQQYSSLPTIILGDLNDTPGSDTLTLATRDKIFQPIYCYESRSTYTYRHRNRPIVLDYMLYNSLLELKEKNIIHLNSNLANQNRYSDHDPVVATFIL